MLSNTKMDKDILVHMEAFGFLLYCSERFVCMQSELRVADEIDGRTCHFEHISRNSASKYTNKYFLHFFVLPPTSGNLSPEKTAKSVQIVQIC
jgi:hypothetical protein